MNTQIAIHWFRRDLRLEDNTALFHALTNNEQVLPLFIFDTEILDSLEDKADARVQFIFDTLMTIRKKLRATGNDIYIAYGSPMEVFKNLISQYTISAVYTNHDFEPYAIQRDNAIKQFLATHNIAFKTCKDQVIFEKEKEALAQMSLNDLRALGPDDEIQEPLASPLPGEQATPGETPAPPEMGGMPEEAPVSPIPPPPAG